jgi:GYF domain 2
MQEHQDGVQAAQGAAGWHLKRDDKQFGPLTDRELLLLAERGGLRAGDLLWKPGYDGWKPVGAVRNVAASNASPAPSIPQHESVNPAEPRRSRA